MDSDFSEMMNRLSENARFALQKADLYSKKYNKGYMGTEHILLGSLAQDVSVGAKVLSSYGMVEKLPKNMLDSKFEERLQRILELGSAIISEHKME